MKKLLFILIILSSFYVKGDIHQIQVWNGYYQFLPSNNITVQLGDTVQWVQLDPPTMTHTITSDNIPNGAIPFDQIWQLPADTFFQYIPQVVGLYQYVCTPHIPFGMIGEFTVVNGPQTYVPDDSFEQALINLGYDNILDNYVATENIDTVTSLNVGYQNISDLTGIEDFTALTELDVKGNQLTSLDVSSNTALTYLNCTWNQLSTLDISINIALETLSSGSNQLTALDVSQNTALTSLRCNDNQLTSLDLRNGNNNLLDTNLYCTDNPNLYCIDVDDAAFSTVNWTVANGNIDPQQYFSNNCTPSAIQEHTTNKELLKITDILGREIKEKRNTPLFYIFENGTVEKKIIIE